MANAPIRLTIYNSDHEVVKELSTSLIPWGILKRALKLAKSLKFEPDADLSALLEGITDDDVDNLTGLVVDVFGGRTTIEELNTGTDIVEMITVLRSIVTKAFGSMDPTKPGQ